MQINEKKQESALKTVPIQYPLSPQEMYKIPRFVKDFWAMPAYRHPKQYLNSHEPKNKQNKPSKTSNMYEKPIVPQPNHTYLNDIIKYRRNSPSPDEYQRLRVWFAPPKKPTQMEHKFKKFPEIALKPSPPSPGVGDYDLLEKDTSIKNRLEKMQKREQAIRKLAAL